MKYAALWLMVLMMKVSPDYDYIVVDNVSADRSAAIAVWVASRGTCFGFPRFPLVFDHEPSGFEVFIAGTFPKAYQPVIMRVYDSVQGVMQKVLLLSEEVAKYKN